MITVLLQAHSKYPIYQTLHLYNEGGDLVLPIVDQDWDIEFGSGFFRCKVARIEPRDSSIVIYSSNKKPVQYFDSEGNQVNTIWVNQPDGEKLLVLPN